MKIVLSILLLVGQLSFAEVKQPGTFVPSKCGQNGPWRVCFGRVVGAPSEFISIAWGHSVPNTFKVIEKVAINGGINPTKSALRLTLVNSAGEKFYAVERFDLRLNKITSLSGTLPNGHVFSATEFEPVFVTQSL